MTNPSGFEPTSITGDGEPPSLQTLVAFASAKSAVGAVFVLAITTAHIVGDTLFAHMSGQDKALVQVLASIALIALLCVVIAVIAHKKSRDNSVGTFRHSLKSRLYSVYIPIILVILLFFIGSYFADFDASAVLVFILFWEIFQNSIDTTVLWGISR